MIKGISLVLMLALVSGCVGVTVNETLTMPALGPVNAHGLVAMLHGKDVYTIDAARSGAAYRDSLKAAPGQGPAGNAAPVAPAVDLTLQITNTTDKDITINLGGDDSRIDLKLEGPGAVTIQNNVMMTREFRIGRPVTIVAGKSHEVKITSLSFGLRGISQSAFWTEPGEYTLTATQVYPFDNKQERVESGGMRITVEKAR
jgi:hypothetical protein